MVGQEGDVAAVRAQGGIGGAADDARGGRSPGPARQGERLRDPVVEKELRLIRGTGLPGQEAPLAEDRDDPAVGAEDGVVEAAGRGDREQQSASPDYSRAAYLAVVGGVSEGAFSAICVIRA